MVPRRQHRCVGRLRSPLRSETELKMERLHTAHHHPSPCPLSRASPLPSSWPLTLSLCPSPLTDSWTPCLLPPELFPSPAPHLLLLISPPLLLPPP